MPRPNEAPHSHAAKASPQLTARATIEKYRLEYYMPRTDEVFGCVTWEGDNTPQWADPVYPRGCGEFSINTEGPEASVSLLSPKDTVTKICGIALEANPKAGSEPSQLPRFRCVEIPAPRTSNLLWVPTEFTGDMHGMSGTPKGYLAYSENPAYKYFDVLRDSAVLGYYPDALLVGSVV
ncbi:MAG: hypothetical protein M1829_005181 [Trizodia sp. TS-e1964]|nr:MAG: hypothetical protein M1829_005181 [Trizodia sp. TS-e1964]